MSQNPPIQILLVDDQKMWLEALPALLSDVAELAIAGIAASGTEALRWCAQTKPDLVLLDLAMAEMDGLETLEALLNMYPDLKTLLLTNHDDVALIMDGLVGGAMGVVLKGSSKSELVHAIRQAYDGHYYCDPLIFGKIVEHFRQQGNIRPKDETPCPLTAREREIIALKAQGKTNKDIAEQLFLSEHTINTHTKNILSKMEAKNTVEAIAKGRKAGCF